MVLTAPRGSQSSKPIASWKSLSSESEKSTPRSRKQPITEGVFSDRQGRPRNFSSLASKPNRSLGSQDRPGSLKTKGWSWIQLLAKRSLKTKKRIAKMLLLRLLLAAKAATADLGVEAAVAVTLGP